MKAERLKQMEEYICKREFVTIEELSEKFGVHKNTVRSDINELVEKGIVEKEYGGISCKAYMIPTTYEEREGMSVESKRIIGQQAASLLENDDVIYVDAGTTTPMIFCNPLLLPERLTVITNSLSVLNWCVQKTNYNLYVLPGKVERQLNSFASFETIDSVKAYNIQKAFLGTRGISEAGDLSSASPIDARIKSTVISCSRQCILMAESKKLGQTAMLNYARLGSFYAWVCDQVNDKAKSLAEEVGTKYLAPIK